MYITVDIVGFSFKFGTEVPLLSFAFGGQIEGFATHGLINEAPCTLFDKIKMMAKMINVFITTIVI